MNPVRKKDYNFIFYFLAVVIFFAFVGFTVTGEEGLLKLYQLKKIKNSLAEKNRSLMMENLALRQEQKSLHDLKNIEHRVRESLGWVHDDEMVFLFPKK